MGACVVLSEVEIPRCLILKLEIPPTAAGMTKGSAKGFPCPTTTRGRG
jgi:hypothetical protein